MSFNSLLAVAGNEAANVATRSPMTEMLIMFFLFLGMWFILIAPQRKRQKKHDEMIHNLKNGDKILTSAGIYGEIVGIRDDRFNVKIADHTTVELHKSCVTTKF